MTLRGLVQATFAVFGAAMFGVLIDGGSPIAAAVDLAFTCAAAYAAYSYLVRRHPPPY